MPTVYSCSNCNYKISLGWFHYHDFSSGYGSQTLLVCTACGTSYAIHIALSPDIQAKMHKLANIIVDDIGSMPYEVRRILREATGRNRSQAQAVLESPPDILVSGQSRSDALLILEKLVRAGAKGHIETTQENQYKQDALFVLISRDDNNWQPCTIVGNRENITGQFELKEQFCAVCHAKGTLTSKIIIPNDSPGLCPSCKQSTLTVEGIWRT
jgi:hypothetical protein